MTALSVAFLVSLYLVVAAGVLGALLERERLLNPDGERGWRWVGALAVTVVFWPIVGLLWPSSRPVPPQPARPGDAEVKQAMEGLGEYLTKVEPLLNTPSLIVQRDVPPTEWDGSRSESWFPQDRNLWRGMPPVPLKDAGQLNALQKAYVGCQVRLLDSGVVLVRGAETWYARGCRCRWALTGEARVVCELHGPGEVSATEEVG